QTMMPIVVSQAGGTEAEGALVLTAYLVGQAAGSLSGGVLADRVDRRTLLCALTLGSLPAHLLAVSLAPGSPAGLAAAAAAGLLNMAIVPPVVIMAQEMLPGGAALGASIAMGLAWATGSVFVLGAGALGDVLGPRDAARVVMPAILVGTALAPHPALRRPRPPVAGGGGCAVRPARRGRGSRRRRACGPCRRLRHAGESAALAGPRPGPWLSVPRHVLHRCERARGGGRRTGARGDRRRRPACASRLDG